MDDAQAQALEEKLKSHLGQLELEHAVFERMVYKNKNQHRRCSYFQYLLKVRRDLRILRTVNMEEILTTCFPVISGKRNKQKIHVLESLKLKKSDTGKPNILERLRGALHLLSQMTEPILKAASGISTLLARSFFIGFSVTFLALLARLRVLVQQILLDAVSVFNLVTSASLKKQSVKIAQDGVEVFREFYPKDKECITLLDCVWKTDKYILLETLQNRESSNEKNVSEDATIGDPLVQYQTSVASLGEDLSPLLEAENGGVTARESSTPPAEAVSSKTNNSLQSEDSEKSEDATSRDCTVQYQTLVFPLGEDIPPSPLIEAGKNGGVTATECSTPIAEAASSETNYGFQTEDLEKPEDEESTNPVSPAKINRESIKPSCRATKVAFLPVKRPSSAIRPDAIEEPPRKKQATSEKDKKEEEDGFYHLLIRGTQKDSLF